METKLKRHASRWDCFQGRERLIRALRAGIGKYCKDWKPPRGVTQFRYFTGCTKAEIFKHFESHFSGRMTWANYGKTGAESDGFYWVVSHVGPVSHCDFSKLDQARLCFNVIENLLPADNEWNQKRGPLGHCFTCRNCGESWSVIYAIGEKHICRSMKPRRNPRPVHYKEPAQVPPSFQLDKIPVLHR